MSKNEKTKSELEKELKELEELEAKVKSKKDTLKFQKMHPIEQSPCSVCNTDFFLVLS